MRDRFRKHFERVTTVIVALFWVWFVVYECTEGQARREDESRLLKLGATIDKLPVGACLGHGTGYSDDWIYMLSDVNNDYQTLKIGRGKTALEAITSAKKVGQ